MLAVLGCDVFKGAVPDGPLLAEALHLVHVDRTHSWTDRQTDRQQLKKITLYLQWWKVTNFEVLVLYFSIFIPCMYISDIDFVLFTSLHLFDDFRYSLLCRLRLKG